MYLGDKNIHSTHRNTVTRGGGQLHAAKDGDQGDDDDADVPRLSRFDGWTLKAADARE